MKIATSLILLLSILSVTGQEINMRTGNYNYYYESGPFFMKSKSSVADKHIAEVKFFEVGKKGEKILSTETSFDQKGNWTHRNFYKKNGKKEKSWDANWTEAGKLKRFERYNANGETIYLTEWEYNEDHNVLNYRTTRKGKPYNDGIMTYQDTLLAEARYGRKGREERSKWTYTYHENGQLKQSVYCDRKGKERHRWSYSCDSEGKQLARKETEVCRKTEVDENGNRIEVYQYNDEKQKIRKLVMTFDPKDNLIELARYNKKDDFISRDLHAYDQKGNRISSIYYTGSRKNPRLNYAYEYNEDDLIVKETNLKKDNSPKWTYVREYNKF